MPPSETELLVIVPDASHDEVKFTYVQNLQELMHLRLLFEEVLELYLQVAGPMTQSRWKVLVDFLMLKNHLIETDRISF